MHIQYQTVKISMAPCPTTAVDPPPTRISTYSHTPSSIQKPSSSPPPPCVSVGVSPICVQHTPMRTFVSRGVSPAPFEDNILPDLAAWFASIPMETQVSLAQQYSPICLTKVTSPVT